jgi:hypothetical protein
VKTATGAERECWICYDETDDAWYEPLSCHHGAHKACLERWLQSAENGDVEYLLPVACPLCKPKAAWALSDIVCIASDQALGNLRTAAVRGYAMSHKDSVMNCPNVGCNQLLSINSSQWPEAGSPAETSVGGFPIYCDQCTTSFCHNCTEGLQQATELHVGCSCDTNKNRVTPGVQAHVQNILDNILCLKCPSCQCQFIDFEGCFAVTCTCNANFCGYCLLQCAGNGACHSHVLVCKLGNGSYFNTVEAFQSTHRLRWHRQLTDFLRTLSSDPNMQRAVADEIKPHAAFVGIHLEANQYL